MSELTEIIDFVKDFSGIDNLNPESDIFNLGVVGDDFHEMIEKYAETFEVDMSGYFWYFHANEEGQNFGALFFKPPYSKVDRIPVTPRLLSEFAETKKWSIDYPVHEMPNKRIDIKINQILGIVFILIILTIWIFN
jgi:hypothetical protein